MKIDHESTMLENNLLILCKSNMASFPFSTWSDQFLWLTP